MTETAAERTEFSGVASDGVRHHVQQVSSSAVTSAPPPRACIRLPCEHGAVTDAPLCAGRMCSGLVMQRGSGRRGVAGLAHRPSVHTRGGRRISLPADAGPVHYSADRVCMSVWWFIADARGSRTPWSGGAAECRVRLGGAASGSLHDASAAPVRR